MAKSIDSQLASRSSISGVQELLNGCICCNLVGQLGDALEALRSGVNPSDSSRDTAEVISQDGARAPDRIVIETSGSAFPATLAMEVNRLARETGAYVLDGVVSCIDVENWQGYEDTSVTAKMQARYTDLIILNKSELVNARRLDDVLDRIGDLDLDPPVPCIKSDRGRIDVEAFLGLDGALAQELGENGSHEKENDHGHSHHKDSNHQSEVETISIKLSSGPKGSVDLTALQKLLTQAPKDEVYRIKAIFRSTEVPKSSEREGPRGIQLDTLESQQLRLFILNWAFGRWNFTVIGGSDVEDSQPHDLALKMTIVTARFESLKWMKRIETGELLRIHGASAASSLQMKRVT